ncbi:hypothetical protein L198_07651 [Cryptococcus wingfieldii CBS 7118]|uniref:Exonuclease 1 n=1 Tax=Cryptococcus wingfieldii CBS 7118 TaxID=1295528 RepID=A0A1E3I5X0_9TREE|nr:hypothetical protein L198_07651 [Cryptococcus wingfieldii CBS 7118]ODN83952.1 hypothetical protein L198_07651 [Cryptococcus wingfieldii CBS 7118]
MGIKGLLPWLKKSQPQVIKNFPIRWAAPEFRGKKIAIDATLMTNRFHFATRGSPDEEQNDIICWYNMISEMRSFGVKPVAIWDQRGVRDWKAGEARKRLHSRATQLARRNHEFMRAARVHLLADATREFNLMSPGEQEAVRAHWEATRFAFVTTADETPDPETPLPTPTQLPLPDDAPPSMAAKIKASLSKQDPQSRERIVSMIDVLSFIVNNYRDSWRPQKLTPKRLPDADGAIEVELDVLEKELQLWTEVSQQGKETNLEEWQKGIESFDQKLEDLVPVEEYTETFRQAALSKEEGDIFNLILSGPSPEPYIPSPGQATLPFVPSNEMSAVKRLEGLIHNLPVVRGAHERALDMPTQGDHVDCQALLQVMGVPVLTAPIPYEAEGLASTLAKAGLVDFVGTEDSDVLGYQAPLLRNISTSSKPLTLIDGSQLREELGLDEETYMTFLVMLGTDASENIPKVGPVTSWKLIQQYGSIDKILAEKEDIVERLGGPEGVALWMEGFRAGQKLFSDLPPIDPGWDLEGKEVDERVVEKYLEEKHGIKLVTIWEKRSLGTDEESEGAVSESKSVLEVSKV